MVWLVAGWAYDLVAIIAVGRLPKLRKLSSHRIHATLRSSIHQWLEKGESEGWELWYYSTSAEDWERLAGEDGYAFVMDGEVQEFVMLANN
ncbi:MAG: hypothetical protein AAGJ46_07590 [Planctomycetota bacterium]